LDDRPRSADPTPPHRPAVWPPPYRRRALTTCRTRPKSCSLQPDGGRKAPEAPYASSGTRAVLPTVTFGIILLFRGGEPGTGDLNEMDFLRRRAALRRLRSASSC